MKTFIIIFFLAVSTLIAGPISSSGHDFLISVNNQDEREIMKDIINGLYTVFGPGVMNGDYASFLSLIFLLGTFIAFFAILKKPSDTTGLMDFVKYQMIAVAILLSLTGGNAKIGIVISDRYGSYSGQGIEDTENLSYLTGYFISLASQMRTSLTSISEDMFGAETVALSADEEWVRDYMGFSTIPAGLSKLFTMNYSKVLDPTSKTNSQLKNYLEQCILLPLNNNSIEHLNILKNEPNLMGSGGINDAIISPEKMVQPPFNTDLEDYLIFNGEEYITCKDFWDRTETTTDNSGQTTQQQVGLHSQLTDGIDRAISGESGINTVVASLTVMSKKSNATELLGASTSLKNTLSNALMSSEFDSVFNKLGVAGDISSAAASSSIANIQSTGMSTGVFMAENLPIMSFMLFAIMIAASPFIFAFSLFPGGLGTLLQYTKTLAWIALWSPIESILNIFINYRMDQLLIESNYNLINLTTDSLINVSSQGATMAGLAGYLYLSVPALSWMLVTGSGVMLGNLAGTLGNSFQQTSSADNMMAGASEQLDAKEISRKLGKDMNVGEASFYKAQQQISSTSAQTAGAYEVYGEDFEQMTDDNYGNATMNTVQTAKSGRGANKIIDGTAQDSVKKEMYDSLKNDDAVSSEIQQIVSKKEAVATETTDKLLNGNAQEATENQQKLNTATTAKTEVTGTVNTLNQDINGNQEELNETTLKKEALQEMISKQKDNVKGLETKQTENPNEDYSTDIEEGKETLKKQKSDLDKLKAKEVSLQSEINTDKEALEEEEAKLSNITNQETELKKKASELEEDKTNIQNNHNKNMESIKAYANSNQAVTDGVDALVAKEEAKEEAKLSNTVPKPESETTSTPTPTSTQEDKPKTKGTEDAPKETVTPSTPNESTQAQTHAEKLQAKLEQANQASSTTLDDIGKGIELSTIQGFMSQGAMGKYGTESGMAMAGFQSSRQQTLTQMATGDQMSQVDDDTMKKSAMINAASEKGGVVGSVKGAEQEMKKSGDGEVKDTKIDSSDMQKLADKVAEAISGSKGSQTASMMATTAEHGGAMNQMSDGATLARDAARNSREMAKTQEKIGDEHLDNLAKENASNLETKDKALHEEKVKSLKDSVKSTMEGQGKSKEEIQEALNKIDVNEVINKQVETGAKGDASQFANTVSSQTAQGDAIYDNSSEDGRMKGITSNAMGKTGQQFSDSDLNTHAELEEEKRNRAGIKGSKKTTEAFSKFKEDEKKQALKKEEQVKQDANLSQKEKNAELMESGLNEDEVDKVNEIDTQIEEQKENLNNPELKKVTKAIINKLEDKKNKIIDTAKQRKSELMETGLNQDEVDEVNEINKQIEKQKENLNNPELKKVTKAILKKLNSKKNAITDSSEEDDKARIQAEEERIFNSQEEVIEAKETISNIAKETKARISKIKNSDISDYVSDVNTFKDTSSISEGDSYGDDAGNAGIYSGGKKGEAARVEANSMNNAGYSGKDAGTLEGQKNSGNLKGILETISSSNVSAEQIAQTNSTGSASQSATRYKVNKNTAQNISNKVLSLAGNEKERDMLSDYLGLEDGKVTNSDFTMAALENLDTTMRNIGINDRTHTITANATDGSNISQTSTKDQTDALTGQVLREVGYLAGEKFNDEDTASWEKEALSAGASLLGAARTAVSLIPIRKAATKAVEKTKEVYTKGGDVVKTITKKVKNRKKKFSQYNSLNNPKIDKI
jgi:hypothetical protein